MTLKQLTTKFFLMLLLSLIVTVNSWANSQQIADPNFTPTVTNPTYGYDQGPVVAIDEAHNNFHTKDGRFQVFAELASNDGYQVESLTEKFTAESLEGIDILVIGNALNAVNVGYENWKGQILPAFETSEIDALETWIKGGGSLLLLADHYPFPKAAENLGLRFGFIFSNGYCFRANSPYLIGQSDPLDNMIAYKSSDNTLRNHLIIKGRNASEAVNQVVTFTGQAFWLTPESTAKKLMVLRFGTLSLYPTQADAFTTTTPMLHNAGMLQGATLELGVGRMAVFGEAGMFSAQLSATEPVFKQGMNNEEATENLQFTLNVLHWLNKIIIGDADGDGVTDDMDKCNNTLPGLAVDSDGCVYVTVEEGDSSCFLQTLAY
ncbi:conserved hypothetical protein, secreted [Candidatus Magnetomorum sp. HK-1]|nr:conserved hypothetical protein, secreted [Candidatus Magnetomorum sp. HK-1]